MPSGQHEACDDYRRTFPYDQIPESVLAELLRTYRYFEDVHKAWVTPPERSKAGMLSFVTSSGGWSDLRIL